MHIFLLIFSPVILTYCRYGESFERMSVEEFELGKQWLSDTFSLIRRVRIFNLLGQLHGSKKSSKFIIAHIENHFFYEI